MLISDKAERQKIFDELHRRVIDEVPLIFLYNGLDAVAMSKAISGFQPWQSKLRMWEVTLAK